MKHPDGLYYYRLASHTVCSKIPMPRHAGKEILPTDPEFAERWAAEPMRLLRQQRDRLISETDWWVLPDRTATQAQLDYRQALRDLPAYSSPELDANGQLINVNWPEKPE